MDLAASLAATRTLADLPAVVSALGHEPLWEEIPVAEWLGAARWKNEVRRAALVGRAGRWHWYGIEAADPEGAARRVGAHRYRQGGACGVIALDAERRRLAVGVASDSAPVLALPLDGPGRLALTTLRRAGADPRPGPVEQSLHVAEALAHRGVDSAFFDAFRDARDRLAAATPAAPPADRDSLALLQLTRILFLYFIQAKGWLDGRDGFLADAVEATLRRGRHPARHLLRPLFFGTLNRPPGERSAAARQFGRIPFLNGGLFEPHPLERRWPADAPATVWRDLFDRLFERFHFTLDDGSATDIAPDTLGRVFEGLMSPEARRLSGTFYTPPQLIRRLLGAGFRALLESRLGVAASRAEGLLASRAPQATTILERCSIVDPAAGSGAFLLGALEQLTGLLTRDTTPRSVTTTRRDILRRNLFGVDISPVAVRLAELRLWLAVVRDDPAGPGDTVEPLPNLDCVVRQGDSLRDPLPPIGYAMPEADQLAEARAAAFGASGSGKRSAISRLRRTEQQAGLAFLRERERRLDRTIAESVADARSLTLFGERRGFDPALREHLRQVRTERARVRDAARRLRRDGELPWFHYPSHFAEVFARGGFDLVTGNPPWVRAESLPPSLRGELAERFRWWNSGGGRGFRHHPDLAVAFTERAVELLSPGGVVTFLLPAKIGTAAYAGHARAALGRECTVNLVSDLTGDPDARFSAAVYPLALVATKRRADPGASARLSLDDADSTVPQQALATSGPWILRSPRIGEIARALAGRFPVLADHGEIHLGVKTGHNAAFLDPPPTVERDLIRLALRGREVRPFTVHPSRSLLWTHDERGEPLSTLPRGAHAHLREWRSALERRADGAGGPWWSLFRVHSVLYRHRVVWPDLARQLTAAPLTDRPDLIPLNTCYVIGVPTVRGSLALAAWFNSGPVRTLARIGADAALGGFARFNARAVGSVPLPLPVLAHPTLCSLAERGRSGEDIQTPLDEVAADLLGLDLRDRAALLADDRR